MLTYQQAQDISIHAPAQGATAKIDKHGQKIAL